MVLKWHATLGESDELTRESAPAVAFCLGQQASSYKEACEIANLDAKSIQAKVEGFQSRLKSRCHGPLEYSTGSPRKAHIASHLRDSVVFLHRTLFDYLNQYEKSQDLIQSKLGSHFDVFVAMIAGMTSTLTYTRNGGDPSVLPEQDLRSIFHWNALTERSTGRHLTELLWIVDRHMARLKPAEVHRTTRRRDLDDEKFRSDHWTSFLPDCGPDKIGYDCSTASCDLLAYTIYTGASLYLREAITRAEKLPSKAGIRRPAPTLWSQCDPNLEHGSSKDTPRARSRAHAHLAWTESLAEGAALPYRHRPQPLSWSCSVARSHEAAREPRR